MKVSNLDVTLKPDNDGNFSLYIGDGYWGKIYLVDGKYCPDNYSLKERFNTPQEAAIRFLKNKAFLDWDENE